jgi:hypothetical protein
MQKNTLAMMLASSVLVCGAANAASSFDGFYGGAGLSKTEMSYSIQNQNNSSVHSAYSVTNYSPTLLLGYSFKTVYGVFIAPEIEAYQSIGDSVYSVYDHGNKVRDWRAKFGLTKMLNIKVGGQVLHNLDVYGKFIRGNTDVSFEKLPGCAGCLSSSTNEDLKGGSIGAIYYLSNKLAVQGEYIKTALESGGAGTEGVTASILYNF